MSDIFALQSLFKEVAPHTRDDDGTVDRGVGGSALTPADLAPPPSSGGAAASGGSGAGRATESSSEIWNADDVPTAAEVEDDDDPRPRPKYDILYKQDVRPEDMYLGSNDLDPSSNSCNRIVIKVQLPGDRVADVDVDVTKQRIVVQSPNYRLATYLPHPVLPKECAAAWDGAKEELTVTLKTHRPDLIRPV